MRRGAKEVAGCYQLAKVLAHLLLELWCSRVKPFYFFVFGCFGGVTSGGA